MLIQKNIVCYTLLGLMIFSSGCGTSGIKNVAIKNPKLVIEEFFDGSLSATGVLKNRSGQVIRTFTASINAYWKEGVGTLEEDFIFDDGEKQRRVWVLKPQSDGRYTATAGDVTGEGLAIISGNQMNLDYVLQVPYKGRTLDINVFDKMYLLDDGTLLSESRMSKFGFTVGQILLTITKQS